MNASLKRRVVDDFRAANCKIASCEECETNRLCLLYAFFSAAGANNRTHFEDAVELLEDNGFHVTDIREERASRMDGFHVIDDSGIHTTGAILLRVVPKTYAEEELK